MVKPLPSIENRQCEVNIRENRLRDMFGKELLGRYSDDDEMWLCAATMSSGVAPVITLNDGHLMPTLALGTGRGTAKEQDSIEEVRQAVFWALEAGYRHIDTASIYGDEEQVGQGIADAIAKGIVKREEVFVTTKLWNDKHACEDVVPALMESLGRLRLDYVDLYLIHFPIATNADGDPLNVDYLETWKGMEDAKKLGLARSIGVSNFNADQLSRLYQYSEIKPAVIEVEVNPTLTQHPLVDFSHRLGVAVMAFSPFGFVVSRDSGDAPPPRADDPVLVTLANKYGKTVTQVVLRYLVDRGLVPIPKSVNKARLAQNINIFDFQLAPEEVAEIDKFNKNVRVIDGKGWEDYPNFPFERN
ncbi:Aldo-keto reductase AKR2E4 [Eumeta japonica]|uniref:Aldo-keto reductase AKR2E4 n=1 Tax=Eumeta variegata TaxID=151549 RepID=A0A4C1SFZ5_EUMVA|nr:Aldo-keto reductase AKR2E4 [Eumeta japonica]